MIGTLNLNPYVPANSHIFSFAARSLPSVAKGSSPVIDAFINSEALFTAALSSWIDNLNTMISEFNVAIPSPQTDAISQTITPITTYPQRGTYPGDDQYATARDTWFVEQRAHGQEVTALVSELDTMIVQLNAQVPESNITHVFSGVNVLLNRSPSSHPTNSAYAAAVEASLNGIHAFCVEIIDLFQKINVMIDLYNENNPGLTQLSSVYINLRLDAAHPAPPTGITENYFTGSSRAQDTVTVSPLVDVDNVSVSETFQMLTAADGAYGEDDTTGDNSGFLPDSMMDSFFYDNAGSFIIRLGSLDPDYKYTVKATAVESLSDSAKYVDFTVQATTIAIQKDPLWTGETFDYSVGAAFELLTPETGNYIDLEVGKVSPVNGQICNGIILERWE